MPVVGVDRFSVIPHAMHTLQVISLLSWFRIERISHVEQVLVEKEKGNTCKPSQACRKVGPMDYIEITKTIEINSIFLPRTTPVFMIFLDQMIYISVKSV